MSEYKMFIDLVSNNVANIKAPEIFKVKIDRDDLWNIYLESFPEGTNEIYRERREYDCSSCSHFIRHYGMIVTVDKDYKIHTMWEGSSKLPAPFNIVGEALDKAVKKKAIEGVLFSDVRKLGHACDHELLDTGKTATWNHFHGVLSESFRKVSTADIPTLAGRRNENYAMLKRALTEVSVDATTTLYELVVQGSIYRGDTFKNQLEEFIKLQTEFASIKKAQIDNWLWIKSFKPISRMMNTSHGTLIKSIAQGMPLDEAVGKYEAMTAPENYKRPKALFTKAMIEKAEKKVMELGLENAMLRRHAVLEDITVNNVMFVDRDAEKRMQGGGIFDSLKQEVTTTVNPKDFERAEEVSIDKFIKDIIPTVSTMEAYIDNAKSGNFLSLIAPGDKESKRFLKWDNNFSWAYKGDIADSSAIKENVSKAGGKVDGVLRFSIMWNDDDGSHNRSDLDAWCYTPKTKIGFNNPKEVGSGGNLDVDITNPRSGVPAVENITFPNLGKMHEGTYKFKVHQYDKRSAGGFKAEVAFNGESYFFEYPETPKNRSYTEVAEVTLNAGKFTIKPLLNVVSEQRAEIWGISTGAFHKVSTMMLSPNYWDEQKGIDLKRYFFFLADCKADESVRGFFNEQLRSEFIPDRKVFEALGSRLMIKPTDNQLSGIGFSRSGEELIVKVTGSVSRILKIKF